MQKTAFLLPLAALILSVCHPAAAGGIAPGATRVIYPESDSQTSLAVTNSDSHERYLIQAWVENDQGQRDHNFVVTPPLFAAAPKSENTLRIVYTGKPLPRDREVVYWMNIKAIPAVDKSAAKGANTLQLAVLSRMKLFMRPDGLNMSEPESAEQLRFQQAAGQVVIKNPTPYYQSLVNIDVGGRKLENTMVAPFGQRELKLPSGGTGPVHYQTVNDYGAITAQKTGKSS
ncbi:MULTISPECIES: fimbria/pilus periplasmic chaperone [Erwiniaceae]|uniref:Fimbria/pilus periplasmic chaperone n=2 Tax=Erwiniaceae TaxID=1903409 RepID=A0ACC5PZ46_ENTAG|nr:MULTISPECIES: fimbria/pilus periplasmic chaperone [Erwiniaceae]MBD8109368.1 fimbria/pilus periplasmic chaperone [Erwinia persicina]MBD8129250.1 fimbria/pilus periplasmic chaperone [Pantoea agglomerans]MBD8156417.1 fimbria/pilus periplasmic chaperone [Pantoea agglomerans]MBD8161184.1 fimbria/pilus periplasmic chaperone [Pantoea agglomerans]MBD8170309.1 fimbria/pilus periplasmic chaperone [Erwinia persicina]